jgi:hypothetical protein
MHGQIAHFLDTVGRQNDVAIITMTTSLYHLEVVPLFRTDIAETGASPHDVHNDAGEFRSGQVRYALLHQTDSRAGRCGHGPDSRRRRAEDHVDRGNLTFGLEKYPSSLRQLY